MKDTVVARVRLIDRPIAALAPLLLALACTDPTSTAAGLTRMDLFGAAVASEDAGVASFTPTDLHLTGPGMPANSEAFNINTAGRSAGVSYDRGPGNDGQATIFNAPSVGGGQIIGVPAGATSAVAYAINDNGEVAGTAWGFFPGPEPRGWRWTSAGGFQMIVGPPGTRSVTVTDINNAGQVVGTFVNDIIVPAGSHAFVVDAAGVFSNIHPAGYDGSSAVAISSNGYITGFVDKSGVPTAGRWSPTGAFLDLKTIPGQFDSWGYDVNAGGFVVGQYGNPIPSIYPAFGYKPSGMFKLPGVIGMPLGLSNKNRAVGWVDNAGFQKGFTMRTTPTIVFLPTLPNTNSWRANGVNTCGDAVGSALFNFITTHAMYWKNAPCD
ncbi:MAG: hypothetical protein U0132_02985 [Gemmatimonadaceae bacterium]